MTHDQFCFWLKGVMEFRDGKPFSLEEMKTIQINLNQVIPEPIDHGNSILFSKEKEDELRALCAEGKKLATAWLATSKPKSYGRLNVQSLKIWNKPKGKQNEQSI